MKTFFEGFVFVFWALIACSGIWIAAMGMPVRGLGVCAMVVLYAEYRSTKARRR